MLNKPCSGSCSDLTMFGKLVLCGVKMKLASKIADAFEHHNLSGMDHNELTNPVVQAASRGCVYREDVIHLLETHPGFLLCGKELLIELNYSGNMAWSEFVKRMRLDD